MAFRYIVRFPALLALPIALRELHSISNKKRPAETRRNDSQCFKLKLKELAPSVAPNDTVIVKSAVSLKRPYSSLRIAAVDAVSTARAAIVA